MTRRPLSLLADEPMSPVEMRFLLKRALEQGRVDVASQLADRILALDAELTRSAHGRMPHA